MLAVTADAADVAADQAEALSLRQRLDDLAGMFAAGTVTGSQLAAGTRQIQERLEAVEARLAASAKGSAVVSVVATPDPVAAWRSASLDAQRSIVETLLEVRILPARRGRPRGWVPGMKYFDPDTVAFEWRTA